MGTFKKRLKNWMNIEDEEDYEGEEYLEIGTVKSKANYYVRSFTLREFEDIRPVIKALRTGKYIVLVDLKPLRENDLVDLRRAVNKLKGVNAEIAGDIAGLSGDWIVVTPHPVKIDKSKPKPPVPEDMEEDELL